MMSIPAAPAHLRAREIWLRSVALLALLFGASLLRAVEPGAFARLPFRVSCGAASGLPCIFCGTTRALHHLLRGEFARALYFNWLAFPVAAIALIALAKLSVEIISRRRFTLPWPKPVLTPRFVTSALVAVFALWIFQVSLALRMHKHELLNPRGVLYAVFVK